MADNEARPCPFCAPGTDRVVAANDLAFAVRDAFPVTPLHSLVIPRRHVADCFDLTPGELEACAELLHQLRDGILGEDPAVLGFNVGVNAGEVAGQGVFHCHFHLMPRRRGDVPNPKGGVRNLMPRQGHPRAEVCPYGGTPD